MKDRTVFAGLRIASSPHRRAAAGRQAPVRRRDPIHIDDPGADQTL